MSVTSVCQTLYNFIHSQHHRFSGFLHLLVSQHLQALEQGSDNRTQVHRRFRQLCSLEHPQNASCMHADDTVVVHVRTRTQRRELNAHTFITNY